MNGTMVLALIRHALTAFGGSLATSGYATSSDVEALIGAVMTIVGFAWSVYEKRMRERAA